MSSFHFLWTTFDSQNARLSSSMGLARPHRGHGGESCDTQQCPSGCIHLGHSLNVSCRSILQYCATARSLCVCISKRLQQKMKMSPKMMTLQSTGREILKAQRSLLLFPVTKFRKILSFIPMGVSLVETAREQLFRG